MTDAPDAATITPGNTWHGTVQAAIDILLSADRPTHDAVVLLRRALGQNAFGNSKRVTIDARDAGFTLNQEQEPITRKPTIDHGPWR